MRRVLIQKRLRLRSGTIKKRCRMHRRHSNDLKKKASLSRFVLYGFGFVSSYSWLMAIIVIFLFFRNLRNPNSMALFLNFPLHTLDLSIMVRPIPNGGFKLHRLFAWIEQWLNGLFATLCIQQLLMVLALLIWWRLLSHAMCCIKHSTSKLYFLIFFLCFLFWEPLDPCCLLATVFVQTMFPDLYDKMKAVQKNLLHDPPSFILLASVYDGAPASLPGSSLDSLPCPNPHHPISFTVDLWSGPDHEW